MSPKLTDKKNNPPMTLTSNNTHETPEDGTIPVKVPSNSAPGGNSSRPRFVGGATTAEEEKALIKGIADRAREGQTIESIVKAHLSALVWDLTRQIEWEMEQMKEALKAAPAEPEDSIVEVDKSHPQNAQAADIIQQNWIQAQMAKAAKKAEKKLAKKLRKEGKERERDSRLRDEADERRRDTERKATVSQRKPQEHIVYAQDRQERREQRMAQRQVNEAAGPADTKTVSNGEWARQDMKNELEVLKVMETNLQARLDALCATEESATKPREPGQELWTDTALADLEAQIERVSGELIENQDQQEKLKKLINQ